MQIKNKETGEEVTIGNELWNLLQIYQSIEVVGTERESWWMNLATQSFDSLPGLIIKEGAESGDVHFYNWARLVFCNPKFCSTVFEFLCVDEEKMLVTRSALIGVDNWRSVEMAPSKKPQSSEDVTNEEG
jgi:hypothetical protein